MPAMQVGSALFAAGTTQEGPVPLRAGSLDEGRRLPATGPQDYLHAGNWLTAFYPAVIRRKYDRLKQLAQVPVEFRRASGAEFDEYVYAWIETLQNFWLGRQETWNTLVTAVQGTAPAQARIAGTDLMLKNLYPPLELFQLYLRREDQAFTDSLPLLERRRPRRPARSQIINLSPHLARPEFRATTAHSGGKTRR
ncbi:Immunity protein 49 [Streptomyces sp. SceaMP-e96]|uniref:immunity 49 family protein n=1 Tax=unclassified Streptomyces TaxID=2593676 RepID=UPI0008238440|nr:MULTISPECIES: immunity 49 family protein [unclassified Streptomyces]SCK50180.1 Immunity protein 49 [Streptomyces sp. SceaMP-e96]